MNKLTESELYLHFYKDILTEKKTKNEIDFIQNYCNLFEGSCVLDIPCFFGRHALRLAAEIPSIKLVAADINFQYLSIAKNVSAEKKLNNIEFIQIDMRQFSFKEIFNYALCLYTSFGYFSDEENIKVLHNYRQCLSKNGTFLLDVINPNLFTEGEFTFANNGKDMILDKTTKSKDNGFWNINRKYIIGSKTYSFDYTLRLYNKQELIVLLSEVGFNKIKIYGGFDGSEYTNESERLIVVAVL